MDDSLWIVDFATDELIQINKDSGNIIDSTSVDRFPEALAVDDQYVYTANAGDDTITRIQKSSISNKVSFNAFQEPKQVVVDKTYVWATLTNNAKMIRIDKITGTSQEVSLVSNPNGIALDETYVWVSLSNNTLIKIDKSTLQTVASISFNGSITALEIDETHLWVLVFLSPDIALYKVEKDDLVIKKQVVLGQNLGSEGLAVDDDFVWVSNRSADNIFQINKKDLVVLNTINVGDFPEGISLDLDSVWVVNTSDRSVSQIDKNSVSVVRTINNVSSGLPFSFGDATGYQYDLFFSNTFEGETIKGKSRNINVIDNALDGSLSTYFEPEKKKKSKFKIEFLASKTIEKIRIYVVLLDNNKPVRLRWRIQTLSDDGWNTVLQDKKKITHNDWLILGKNLNLATDKVRIKIDNLEIEDNRHSFGIAEVYGLET